MQDRLNTEKETLELQLSELQRAKVDLQCEVGMLLRGKVISRVSCERF